MNNNNNSNIKKGMGLTDAIFIVFLVLKLTNVINWSWWWVTAPLWMPVVLIIVLLGVAALIKLVSK